MQDTSVINDENIFNLGDSWQEFPIETVELLFSQAEQSLENTIEISRMITDKAYMIIGILITFILGGIGFILNLWLKDGEFKMPSEGALLLMFATAATVVWLTAILWKLHAVIQKREMRSKGTNPNILISSYWIQDTIKDNHKWLLFTLCDGYQKRINHNEEQNARRIKIVQDAINQLTILPFVFAGILLCLCFFIGCFVV